MAGCKPVDARVGRDWRGLCPRSSNWNVTAGARDNPALRRKGLIQVFRRAEGGRVGAEDPFASAQWTWVG